MKLGFAFIPVPVAIYQRQDLLVIDKLLIGRILSFGDKECFLSQETFAEELGVTRKHIQERLQFLVEKCIVEATRRRHGKSYRVVPDVTSRLHLEDVTHGLHLDPDVTCGLREMSPTGDVRCNPQVTQVEVLEEVLEEIDRSIDDSSNEKTKTTWWEKASEDGDELLELAKASLHGSRAACFSEKFGGQVHALKATRRPDKKIVEQICALFTSFTDFEAWSGDTIKRDLGARANGAGYGLYLHDAKQFAENLTGRREAEEARRNMPCGSCKGRGYLLSLYSNFVGRGEEAQVVNAHACGCKKAAELSGEDLRRIETEYVAKRGGIYESMGNTYKLIARCEL